MLAGAEMSDEELKQKYRGISRNITRTGGQARMSSFGMVLTHQTSVVGGFSAAPQKRVDGVWPRVR